MAEPIETHTSGEDGLTAFVTFTAADHYFGIPVNHVQDILTPDTIARVPLGPVEVRGLINLRGRIVTVIDVRTRLSLGASTAVGPGKCVTVESDGEFYTLLVDRVGDVVSLSEQAREPNPATLDPQWCELASGVFRTDDKLLIALDVERLLNIRGKA
jgi:purine-binding chemotaxis protein CheW